MSQGENNSTSRIVLIVPVRHVKTVKSALEHAERLDRLSSITPETRQPKTGEKDASPQSLNSSDNQLHSAAFGSAQCSAVLMSTAACAPDSEGTARVPGLRFDGTSRQYRRPSDLRNTTLPGAVRDSDSDPSPASSFQSASDATKFPALLFDVASGEYTSPSAIQHQEKQNPSHDSAARTLAETSIKGTGVSSDFPSLQFDTASGEYRSPPSEAQLPQKEASSTAKFSALHFDVASGEYKDISEALQIRHHGGNDNEQYMRVPTTFPHTISGDGEVGVFDQLDVDELKSKILEELALSELHELIMLSHHVVPGTDASSRPSRNPLHKALSIALDSLSDDILAPLAISKAHLISQFPDAYSVYKPMLLLPHNVFVQEAWMTLLAVHPIDSRLLAPIWRHMAEAVGAKRVAINSPIPLQTDSPPQDSLESSAKQNILRSPVNITPIYGDFGPVPTPQTLSSPSASDFAAALWVSTTQNGIFQTWAPLYTMFSRGNIKEKSRILHLPTVATVFEVPSAAADLYAGIGYFAFSYKKAGMGRLSGIETVLCWELNPWSVEGLKRGAEMNGWTCRIFKEDEMPQDAEGWKKWRRDLETKRSQREDFWVFQMSNEFAAPVVQQLAGLGLPIRHVNLGLLPSSALSWSTAVTILDVERGGWLHVHENVGVKDIVSRAEAINTEIETMVAGLETEAARRTVVVEHVERVKMYAPGVVHCVFDIRVNGTDSQKALSQQRANLAANLV